MKDARAIGERVRPLAGRVGGCLLVWLLWLPLWGQERVRLTGYVLDEEGNALQGAYVYTPDRQAAATADEEGFFALEASMPVSVLQTEYVGFQPLRHPVERMGDVQVLVLTPATQLQEVMVSGGGLGAMKDFESTINTERLTAQALTRAACCNLSESFETNPSVDVAYSDAVTGAKQIQLLGLAGTYVQMLTENFPNLRGVAATYGLDYIPGPWMQSIQVSKGAASVCNGYESITGQINVEYKKPPTAAPLLINLFASDAGRYEGNAVGAFRLSDRLSTALFINYYNEEQAHDGDGDSFLDMPKMHALSLMNRWHYQTPSFVSQSGVKWLTDRRRSGQTTRHSSTTMAPDELYRITNATDRLELFTKNGFVIDGDREQSIALIASGSYHDYQSSYAGTRTYNMYETNAYAALLYEDSPTEHHKIAAGANYNYDRYEQRGTIVEACARGERSVQEHAIGLYGEWTWKPAETLTLMAGLRGDYSSRYDLFATPRLHLRYAPLPWLTLRASAGKGYRTALALPNNSYLLASSRTLHIDTDLHQEEAWNYGLTATLTLPLAGRDLEVNAEWYFTDFQHQAVVDLDQDAHAVYIYDLRGSSTSSVLQVDASYMLLPRLTLLAAYRWMDVRCTYNGRKMRKLLTSRYKALFTATYETPLKRWQMDLTLQLNGGGRMPTPDASNPLWDTRFHAYERLNAQLTRRFRNVDIYAGGENLTDFRQKNPIIAASEPFGSDFDATLIYGPTMGRKLYVGIRYTISEK